MDLLYTTCYFKISNIPRLKCSLCIAFNESILFISNAFSEGVRNKAPKVFKEFVFWSTFVLLRASPDAKLACLNVPYFIFCHICSVFAVYAKRNDKVLSYICILKLYISF